MAFYISCRIYDECYDFALFGAKSNDSPHIHLYNKDVLSNKCIQSIIKNNNRKKYEHKCDIIIYLSKDLIISLFYNHLYLYVFTLSK